MIMIKVKCSDSEINLPTIENYLFKLLEESYSETYQRYINHGALNERPNIGVSF